MKQQNGYSRRDFLKVVGATSGLLASGCADKVSEKIIPYVIQPDEIIPGVATWYASSCGECDAGCGILVRTREGRAVKIEGNPNHPINSGGLCAHGQSALQALYDPDRIRNPLERTKEGELKSISWEQGIDRIALQLSQLGEGREAVLLTNPLSGSSKALVKEFIGKFPKFRHVEYSLFDKAALDQAAEHSFGAGVRTHFDFAKAEEIVSFGADYLETWISPVEFARGWAQQRRIGEHGERGHSVHIEPRLSLTAANSDEWLQNRPGSESLIMLALLKSILVKGGSAKISDSAREQLTNFVKDIDIAKTLQSTEISPATLDKLAARLLKKEGKSLIVAGGASVSADALNVSILANLINISLGNIGSTVLLRKSEEQIVDSFEALNALIKDMNDKKVGLLLVSGVNPVFTHSQSLEFQKGLAKVSLMISVSTALDETTSMANIILPLSHSLETWSDANPAPGVYNLIQPAMQPLYESQSLGDTLIAIAAKQNQKISDAASLYEYIKLQWQKRTGDNAFESRFAAYVEHGGDWSGQVKDSSNAELQASATKKLAIDTSHNDGGPLLLVYPSVNSFDGSSANRPWMQELPNPLTSSVWGNWIEIHTDVAKEAGLDTGDTAEIVTEHKSPNDKGELVSAIAKIIAPVVVTDHIHRSLFAMPIGQGHTSYGRYAAGIAENPLALLDRQSRSFFAKLPDPTAQQNSVRRADWSQKFVRIQKFDSQHDRGILKSVALGAVGGNAALEKSGHFGAESHHGSEKPGTEHHGSELGEHTEPGQMYRQMEHPLYRWGMTIDLDACTGCSACVVACYAENNVPVVGKELCGQGREMAWLRIDRYMDGPKTRPVSGFMPMLCQHCGNAPCEPVCPLYATYHNEEGLNGMVYNRCVGTRYCANNCTYKVRRFNWFKYDWPEPLNWQLNPDVTVREVGVMEKCSFCVQRIREGENRAKDLGRPVQDGEIQPACASSCPTQAIRFGNLNEQSTKVSKDRQDNRGYRCLDEEINTQPAITYLARVTNDQLT